VVEGWTWRDEDDGDAADFAASVERDLDQLPTLDEFDRR